MPTPKNAASKPARAKRAPKPRKGIKDQPAKAVVADAPPADDLPEAPPAAPDGGAPETVEPVTEDEQPDQVESQDEQPDHDTGPANPPAVERVKIGEASGLLMLMLADDVLSRLDEGFQKRVQDQRSLPCALGLHEEVQRSEGRCAPIIFTVADDGGLHLFAHSETLSAALNLGMERVAVLLVLNSDAGALQTSLATGFYRKSPPSTPDDEDDLFLRVMSHYQES